MHVRFKERLALSHSGYRSRNWTFKFYSVMPSSDPSPIQSKSHMPLWEGKETCLPFSSYTKISCHEGWLWLPSPHVSRSKKPSATGRDHGAQDSANYTKQRSAVCGRGTENFSCTRYSTNIRTWSPLGRCVGKNKKPDCALYVELSRKRWLPIPDGKSETLGKVPLLRRRCPGPG